MSRKTQPHPLPWLLAVVLALVVVILGAYTRLSDAGLAWREMHGATMARPSAGCCATSVMCRIP